MIFYVLVLLIKKNKLWGYQHFPMSGMYTHKLEVKQNGRRKSCDVSFSPARQPKKNTER